MDKQISQAVIRRLPRYYRYLGELLDEGVERISSNDLSKTMHVTASQIRQDLNNFGGFGQQGYGYNVAYLHEEIGNILGVNVGLFDVNPELKGKMVRDMPVQMLDELPEFLKNNEVEIAALTLPKQNAKATALKLVSLGVHAIWNFAHVDLDDIPDVVIENVHLSDSLMQLSYNITQHKK